MSHLEPGSLIFKYSSDGISTIVAVAPLNRDALQSLVANMRQIVFHGTQVPFRVIHLDPVKGTRQEEHIPGCATCSQ